MSNSSYGLELGGGGEGEEGDFYGITDSRGRSWPKFYCCAAHQVSPSCGNDRLCRVVAAQPCKRTVINVYYCRAN